MTVVTKETIELVDAEDDAAVEELIEASVPVRRPSSKPRPWTQPLVGAAVKPNDMPRDEDLEPVAIPAASEYFGSSLGGQ